MSQKLFTHFLSQKRFTHSIWKVFARDTLPTGKFWLFMSLLLTISHRHLALRLSSVPVVSTVEIQRAVSPEETLDRKGPGSVFSEFFIDLLITDFLQMSSWLWQWGLDLREETRGISISECDHNQVTPCFVKSIWTLLLITKNIATIANAVEGHSGCLESL